MRERDLETRPRGLRLRVCEWGEAEPGRLPILVLHGFLEQGAAWDAVARQLPGRIVAPDMRGHGRSEHVGRGGFYHFWDYVGDVDAVVEHLGGRVDLIGHSMGGTVASLFAGARPDAVRRLVLVEGLGPPDTTGQAVDRARQFLDHLRRPPRHGGLEDVEAAAHRLRMFNGALSSEGAAHLAERLVRPAEPDDPQVHPDQAGALTWGWDALHRARSPVPFDASLFRRFLAEITAPTLLVDGGRSGFVVPDNAERRGALRDARHVVIEGAGHLVHHDRPDALARVIAEHLAASS